MGIEGLMFSESQALPARGCGTEGGRQLCMCVSAPARSRVGSVGAGCGGYRLGAVGVLYVCVFACVR